MAFAANYHLDEEEEDYVLRHAPAFLGPTAVEVRDTLFCGRVRYHRGAARLLDEAIANAVDHCLAAAQEAVYVDFVRDMLEVINPARVPVNGRLGFCNTVIPRALLRTPRVSSHDGYHTLVGRYGMGLKMIHLLSEDVTVEVSDGEASYTYQPDGNDDYEEIVSDSPLWDLRAGNRFFRLRFAVSAAAFGTQRAVVMDGLEDYLRSRLFELSFYLYETKHDISLFYNGERVCCASPRLAGPVIVVKRFPVTYCTGLGRSFQGQASAFLYRDPDVSSASLGRDSLVNGVRVENLSSAREVLRRLEEASPLACVAGINAYLVIECPGIVFSDHAKTRVNGCFEIPAGLFSARDGARVAARPERRPSLRELGVFVATRMLPLDLIAASYVASVMPVDSMSGRLVIAMLIARYAMIKFLS
ncbi:ORF114 [Saltwater crocodilepox virus]|nr:ORF116 [Saltwater crocodilepox virus]QGT47631.1 ORF114 [Saltwater crocodilepox virus]